MGGRTAVVSAADRDRVDDEGMPVAFTAHTQELLRVAHRSLGDRGLAEDAVQETLVRAWRASDRYDAERSSPRTWLFAILRNVVIDLDRARRARPPLETGVATEPATEDDAFDRALLTWQVETALARLRPEHRRVLVEVHYQGRPYAEVATALGIAEGTVKSRVFYALRSLRDALEELGWSERGER